MNRKKLLTRITYLILFIFLLNFLAGKFYWYSTLWWFDMPMHFFGGLFLGLCMVYFFPPKGLNSISFFKVIFGVLLLSIGWEVFEFFVDENIAQNGFNILDTLSDICFDIAGGTTAMIYFFKRILLV
jgi:hypothetical protein